MISLDMKYTSLYWTLRFIENELDTHTKIYDNYYAVTIYAEKQFVDYGCKIQLENKTCGDLTRHKDFVILECVDRLLKKNIKPEMISIFRTNDKYDILINDKIAVFCEHWSDDFLITAKQFKTDSRYSYSVIYTSRLVSGLLEFKSVILHNGGKYNYGLFEADANINSPKLRMAKTTEVEQVKDIADFDIFEDKLIAYNGKSKIVKVPEGITAIEASAFWNNTAVEEIILPQSLKCLDGDAFYYCTNLKKINIPSSVWIMGNNPFAGCPKLAEIKNYSKHFIMDDGILYDQTKKNLIHYSIVKKDKRFDIPHGVICLGKHCFFDCNNLEKITIPKSVIRFENNPFSGCDKLMLDNRSLHYIVENGIIYNKFKTAIVGALNGMKIDKFIVPETVTLISRNSFWNCKKIKKIVITKNVKVIGYNPFAGCEELIIESRNDNFPVINNLVLNKNGTEILCCTNTTAKMGVQIPKEVKTVARGAFSGCISLNEINLSNIEIIDKSAFTRCIGLRVIFIPDSVKYIGEWAFAYCVNLTTINIGKNTKIDRNAFSECPAKIKIRS
jgi:hypothetical protein